VQRIVIRGKRCELGLGNPSLVSLVEAREQALANRKLAREGGNPLQPKRGPGRPRGSVNKYTKTVKEALLQSFHNQGGVNFWDKLAKRDRGSTRSA